MYTAFCVSMLSPLDLKRDIETLGLNLAFLSLLSVFSLAGSGPEPKSTLAWSLSKSYSAVHSSCSEVHRQTQQMFSSPEAKVPKEVTPNWLLQEENIWIIYSIKLQIY